MNVLSWLLFGLMVGIVAHAIDPQSNRGGLVGTIILGITGALLGGFLANLLFGFTLDTFTLSSFLTAVAGSIAILMLSRVVKYRV